jgi:hypothetical protein
VYKVVAKAIQLMRAKHFLNAVQRAGEHRRVLVAGFSFPDNNLNNLIYNFMDLYNLEKLVRISVSNEHPAFSYSWRKRKTFLGIEIQKEGVYYDFFGGSFESSKVPKNMVLKNGILHYKPSVALIYEAKIQKTYYFENIEEANDFCDKVKELSGAKFFS